MDKLKRYNHYGRDGFKYCMSEDVAALEAKNAELAEQVEAFNRLTTALGNAAIKYTDADGWYCQDPIELVNDICNYAEGIATDAEDRADRAEEMARVFAEELESRCPAFKCEFVDRCSGNCSLAAELNGEFDALASELDQE